MSGNTFLYISSVLTNKYAILIDSINILPFYTYSPLLLH